MPINFVVKLAVTVAMEAAQMAMQASKRTTGPRLDELTVTTADFGTPIPRFLGERRFACPVFHAEDLKEVERNTKVKGGGKQTTYSYKATFACAIADNAIDKVLKIFFDDKLVYDATGAGPISYASSLGIDLNSVMRTYTGSETQLPDPRYASWCEDRYGPNSAPAYRGLSYLFFEELPVDNFGNRIPQISVIAVSAAAPAYPFETRTSSQTTDGKFTFGGTWAAYWDQTGGIEWWDVPSRTQISDSPGPGFIASVVSALGLGSDGTAYQAGAIISGVTAYPFLATTPPGGTPTVTAISTSAPAIFQVTRVLAGSVYTTYSDHAGYVLFTNDVPDASLGARDFCIDGDGHVWGVSQPAGSSNSFTISQLTGGAASATFTGLVTRANRSQARICHAAEFGQFIVTTDGKYYLIDDTSYSVTASGTAAWGSAELPFDNPSAQSFWDGYNQYSTKDCSLLQTVTPSNFYFPISGHAQAYDPVNHAIWQRRSVGASIDILYIDRAGNNGTTLGAIVSKMCDAAGLTDRDTSALTQAVKGYSWTRGDVKSQMEPLLDIHDVDARPHDFTIQFLPRGGAPVGSIVTADFAKNGDSPRYIVTTKQDTDLPRLLRVNYADVDFEQQINNILSPLPADTVDSQQDAVIDLTTYATDPNEAQQLGDRYMRRQWNSRESITCSVTPQEEALEPGDVTTLYLDGIGQNVRLTGQTFVAGGRIECTWTRDEVNLAALNAATTGPALEARDPQVITFPAPIRGFVIDAPYRWDSDADVRPLLYDSAGVYADLAFPGAAILEAAPDGVYDELFATVSTGATWGSCLGTLGAVASPWVWDRGNTLNLTLQHGTLTSVTEADIDADPTLNLVLVGRPGNWEYLNFTTATLNGDGSWTLSGFKRGRRGTEWACGGHAGGEAVVLASSLDVDEMGTDDVGASLSFKAQAIGRSLDAATAIDVAYSGATLKPYAPASIKWAYDGTDLTGTIARRTRIGGAWVGGSVIPLSENSEAYEVDVYNGGTFKRTIAVSGTNVFTYTGAMATADGITLPTPPSVNVYQMSDAVGRGYALAA